jgi:hypothetical protein
MQRNAGQKIAFVVAILCYLAAFGCAVAAILYEVEGPNDAVHASLMASVVFFASCGGVLHVIANTRLSGMPSVTDDETAHRD